MSQIYKILIIEDEPPAANRVVKLLEGSVGNYEIVDIIDSVSSAIAFLNNANDLDLIFMDIQLSDGLSFEIFNQVQINVPVIFTTAFDNYMLNAFKVHSVDYLLKPIEPDEFKSALQKFQKYYNHPIDRTTDFQDILNQFLKPNYKQRFLIKSGSEIKYLETEQIAYFYSDDGYTHIISCANRKHILDYKLDELERLLDPKIFFRINRKIIVGLPAIRKIESYFNGRYVLSLDPKFNDDVIVSRERAASFKSWLDQ